MREIKFRGYDEENKCWRYGHLFETVEGIRRCYNIVEGREVKYYVSPESIGQYTGLHDKNGKEIYEGDILGDDKGFVFCIVEHICDKRKARFGWGEEGHSTFSGFFFHGYSGSPESFKVVGNIHKNPELIK